MTSIFMPLLGIDFGLKKIGLALAEGPLATPLEVIKNDEKSLAKISRLCRVHQIEKIIMGIPEGGIVGRVREFANKLQKQTGRPVDLYEETLTTKEAIVKMREAGRTKKFRTKKEDAFAAAIILQNYLDK